VFIIPYLIFLITLSWFILSEWKEVVELFLMANNPANGHDVAQAVSRRLPTAAAQVQAVVRSCGIGGGRSGTGAGFLRIRWFPPSILIPPIAPHSSSSIIRG
jgi:hypothetical protein